MEYLFPIPTLYEIYNNKVPILTFNTIYMIEIEFYQYKIKKNNNNKKLIEQLYLYRKKQKYYKYTIFFLLILYFIYIKKNIIQKLLKLIF